MKLLVIGSGGREYAICQRLARENPDFTIYCLPGNPAMKFVHRVDHIRVKDTAKILEFALSEGINFCLVTPDDPLALGLVDLLEDHGIGCFGPRQKAAKLESSKSFAKDFMMRHGIATGDYSEFTDYEGALAFCQQKDFPLVIKADGLALGKGVAIVQNLSEAKTVLEDFLLDHKFGKSSEKIIIEEFLRGPEISVLSLCDSKIILPLKSSMDHKAAYDGDQGPNTGGMGCIAANPYFTPAVAEDFQKNILEPTLKGLKVDGLDFRGCLFFGLMLTDKGLKLLEYNARFGDPETQAVLPLLKNKLWPLLEMTSQAKLDQVRLDYRDLYSCCLVLAAEGYPEKPYKGGRITYPEGLEDQLIFAGVGEDQAGYYSSSGRVLNVLGLGSSLKEAVDKAYEAAEQIKFDHSFYRKDIGRKALRGD